MASASTSRTTDSTALLSSTRTSRRSTLDSVSLVDDAKEAEPSAEVSLAKVASEKQLPWIYVPPPRHFIEVYYGEMWPMLMNINCKKSVFLDYIRRRIPPIAVESMELCDLQGNVVGIANVEPSDYVINLFQPGFIYITCEMLRQHGYVADIKPCFGEWEERFPYIKEGLAAWIEKTKKAAEPKVLKKVSSQLKRGRAGRRTPTW
ncbi:uncharacterized protein LOC131939306 [Physella acuta]|uniref:uncharacterized protein LOC131939306 n=1 Tax=Physella acuta TaxID=109671 RepID=UPI0027DB4AAB|nr:uncharacterized protein LOC131939306 [Physella acuta]